MFGFLYEVLVIRDLKIYAGYIKGKLRHFRDNVNGLEVDAIVTNENADMELLK